ncbi:heat stress transcription factor a-7a [Phtheirospermum japonicum]|uniref:Heat stress transcription factor a-7a n=1 Tax=Phtheirospermum japonicum TaxID=374723 RepID=A0A830D3Q3_9LAMI|nr:heat stress transcription factor a-7a [Phtheirospermum japonicum]
MSTTEQNIIENGEDSKNDEVVVLDGGCGGSFCFSGAACKPIPPFLLKIHDMLENKGTNCSVISWRCNGTSFVITNPHSFSDNVLPMYFRHNNFQSFIAQLNSYGFRKISWEHWEYSHEYFRKGERHLLKNIKRRNQISRPSSSDTHLSLGGAPRDVEKEVQVMMHEHDHLKMEIEKLKDKQEALERRLASLKDQAMVINTEKGAKGIMEIAEGLLRKRKLEETENSATPLIDDNNNNSCLTNIAEFMSEHFKQGNYKMPVLDDRTNNTLISLEDMFGESSSSDWVEYLKDLLEKANYPKS